MVPQMTSRTSRCKLWVRNSNRDLDVNAKGWSEGLEVGELAQEGVG